MLLCYTTAGSSSAAAGGGGGGIYSIETDGQISKSGYVYISYRIGRTLSSGGGGIRRLVGSNRS